MLAELAAYKQQTGGFKLAGMRKDLAKWVSNQRGQKKLFDRPGTESKISRERITALDKIHFTWAAKGDDDGRGTTRKKPKVSKKRKR